MSYLSLYKLFYKDPQHFEEIYSARFHDEAAVHLDFSIGEYPAFFLETPELLKRVINIQRLDKAIKQIKLPPVAKNQFVERCLVDEIIITNSIEGVHSTRREIGDVLENLSNNGPRNRFYGLVEKYSLLSGNRPIPLSDCRDIRTLYDELLGEEILLEDSQDMPDGQIFRQGPVSVDNAAQKEIHRDLYPESAIIAAMEKALAILNDEDIEPLFRIALFHYLFGYIHPFYDGNGRISRFISSYLLSRELEKLLAYRLSYTIKENISDYYDAFKTCNDPRNRGDLTPFLYSFMSLVELSTRQLLDSLVERQVKLDHYAASLSSLPHFADKQMNDLYYLLLQAALFADEGIPTQDLLGVLEISRSTLDKRLQPVDEAGLLLINQVGNRKYYQLNLLEVDKLMSVVARPIPDDKPTEAAENSSL